VAAIDIIDGITSQTAAPAASQCSTSQAVSAKVKKTAAMDSMF